MKDRRRYMEEDRGWLHQIRGRLNVYSSILFAS